MKNKKKTKQELLDDLASSEQQLEWLEYRHIYDLKEQLKLFKFTQDEIDEYGLYRYPKENS